MSRLQVPLPCRTAACDDQWASSLLRTARHTDARWLPAIDRDALAWAFERAGRCMENVRR